MKEAVVVVHLSVIHLRDCLQMPRFASGSFLSFEEVLQLAPRLELGEPTSSFGRMVSLSLNSSAS